MPISTQRSASVSDDAPSEIVQTPTVRGSLPFFKRISKAVSFKVLVKGVGKFAVS
jgi:hypothetical protein